ncbi:unnamed protein product [Sphagnum balticum]
MRIQCNEVHPVCGSCERHGSVCEWGRPGQPSTTTSQAPKAKAYDIRPKQQNSLPAPSKASALEESTERRLLELRLLHQFMAETGLSISVPGDPGVQEMALRTPKLAFKHTALLYSIYTISALHLSKLEPQDPSHDEIYQRYLSLTLRDHRIDVANLSKANADAAHCTSNYPRICVFAQLQERDLNPYAPPREWMQMTNVTGYSLNNSAWKLIADDKNSILRSMIEKAPGLTTREGGLRDDASLFQEENRRALQYLMRRTETQIVNETWDEKIQTAYESTLSILGAAQLAISANEPRATIFRRLILVPTLVERDFTELVNKEQPRALVIMAYYFALLHDFRDFWWIGNAGAREVRRHL